MKISGKEAHSVMLSDSPDIMNIEEIANAMLTLAANEKMRHEYGENGYRRLMNKYTIKQMRSTYADIYRELTKKKTS